MKGVLSIPRLLIATIGLGLGFYSKQRRAIILIVMETVLARFGSHINRRRLIGRAIRILVRLHPQPQPHDVDSQAQIIPKSSKTRSNTATFIRCLKHFGVVARACDLFVSDPIGAPYGITACFANYKWR
jgi:hypothetical protein